MYIAVLLPSILALFALYKRKLTLSAVIAAWIMGIMITYCAGIPGFIALAGTFIGTILSDKLKKDKDDATRNVYQIFSNVLVASLCTLLYFVKKNDIFYVMYYAVIGSSLADTFASSFGALSKQEPINPINFRKMKKGESGAISFLGLSASVLAGILIGGIYYYVTSNIGNYFVIIIMSLLGSYIDSLLGATMQGKYKCIKCHKAVEKKVHCDKETKLVKGYSFINNDAVNLFNNIFVFFITYIVLK